MSGPTLPLVIVALVLLAFDGTPVERVEVLTAGTHVVAEGDGAIVVADAEVVVEPGSRHSSPVYVVGGTLIVEGSIDHLTQLGGAVRVSGNGAIGEARALGGTLVDPAGGVRSIIRFEDIAPDTDTGAGWPTLIVASMLFALIGAVAHWRRPENADNVTHAIRAHWVVSGSVGLLMVLGGLSLLVFMAFTIVLLPVAVLGGVLGLLLVGVGLLGWSGLVPAERSGHERAVRIASIASMPAALSVVGRIPVIGDTVVLGVLVVGLGAAVTTFMGYRRFEPPELPG